MTKQITELYRKFRAQGERAGTAIYNAKAVGAFQEMESRGLVRIRAEDEQEGYFDVFGEPDSEKERKAIVKELESKGCWYVKTEYLIDEDQWEHADGIGMCVYDNPCSPFENCYVPELMGHAVRQLLENWNAEQPGEHEFAEIAA